MPAKKYRVTLTAAERARLHELLSRGTAAARKLTHARILVKADDAPDGPAWGDAQIVEAFDVSRPTVERVRQQFVAEGLDAALARRQSPTQRRGKLDGEQEARLVALACSAPPAGRARWTMRLLAERFVILADDEEQPVSHETVRRTLHKNELKPWLKDCWCIPPDADAAFVYHVYQMEDVLGVYTRPYDPRYPQVCFDESNKQLVSEVAPPQPSAPGQPAREDYEYVREGVANLFLWCEPLRGRRQMRVTDRRTTIDWAHGIKDLVEGHYPDAEKLVVVLDNRNTHSPASLYEAFAPAEAKRLADRLERHSTPKHGSWLNMAEIEFSILGRQCLDRRIPDQATLRQEVASWEAARNAAGSTIDWRFTTADARIKLKHPYPSYTA